MMIMPRKIWTDLRKCDVRESHLEKKIALKQTWLSTDNWAACLICIIFPSYLAEDRLTRLRDELQLTEDKLKQATKDLKNIGDHAVSDKEEQKMAIRQKMARKMRTVSKINYNWFQKVQFISKWLW